MSILKAVWRAFWPWYRRLSLVPMFVVTCVLGVAAIVTIDKLPLPAAQHTELRSLATALLIVAALFVIVVGAIRQRR